MRKKHEIKLISFVTTQNNIGDTVNTPVKRPVLAERKSVRQSEFYQAQITDLKPEIIYEVWTAEYQGENTLEDEHGQQYTIIRTYDKNEIDTELICEGLVSGG